MAKYVGKKVMLSFRPFKQNIKYTLSISNISDLQGNIMGKQEFSFADYKIQPLDIIINEVLFYPRNGGSDFVEIYNKTEFDLNLESIYLATIDKNTGLLKSMVKITDSVIRSKDYAILTTDPENIKAQYIVRSPEKIIKLKTIPSFPNVEGIVVLALQDSTIIDRFDYSEKMHFPLLKDKSGVSLERRNPENSTNISSNWQSAAETVGWATPTYKNSQYNEFLYLQEPFSISPLIFSPDNDGVDDMLDISYKLDADGYIANISIFDVKGKIIKYLKRNVLLGIEGNFVWDGVTEQNQKAPMGMYVIFIGIFDTKGNKKEYKKTVILSGK